MTSLAGRFIYSITIFLNAALLFWVQPLVGKMILPFAGGAPAVWNTCLFFFQGTLLAGYVYAHFGSRALGPRRHAVLHFAIVLAGVVFLPVAFGKETFAALERHPAATILVALAASVGFPFLVLSAGSPLLQKWFAATGHADAADPYFLYAASNLGSFAGLIAYPILLEPYFTLGEQNQLWFAGYAILLVMFILCAWPFLRTKLVTAQAGGASGPIGSAPMGGVSDAPVNSFRRIRWLLWSFAPSSLLLGVTTYITTDVASVPLFWIVPLGIYLLSYAVAFARPAWTIHPVAVRLQALLVCIATVNYFVEVIRLPWLVVTLQLMAFFATAAVCHGRLAEDRPPIRYLTEFYLWISIGGMLGGFFNSLIAPRLFLRVQEYPLAIIVAVMLRPYLIKSATAMKVNLHDFLLPLGLGLVYFGVSYQARETSWLSARSEFALLFGLAALSCLYFARRPVRFGLGLLAVFLATSADPDGFSTTLFRGRSFFGVYRVTVNQAGTRHSLLHGTTLHGTQNLAAKLRTTAISYYYPTGPVGEIFRFFAQPRARARVGIVGLGTGGLVCYAKPGQVFTFFEIDPLVERIARDPRYFTYLRDCPAQVTIEIGDARVSLAKAQDRQFDLLVLDAFSSDAIPTHLLTVEALRLYLTKLVNDGILAIHISNRYLALEPILGRAANELGVSALIRSDDERTDEESEQGKFSSTWVIFSRSDKALAAFTQSLGWQALEAGRDLWTDSYSNILYVLKRK